VDLMTTQRQLSAAANDHLRGAHVRVQVTSVAQDFTMLANSVLRNDFQHPDGRPVQLRGLDRAALLQLLSYSWAHADAEWRLDMDLFVAAFAESRSTVYSALSRLEMEGFLVRHRENDQETGQFCWYWEVTDQPGTLVSIPQRRSGPGGKPQVNPRSGIPDMVPPDMAGSDAATSYREDLYLPTSPNLGSVGARETDGGMEGGGNPQRDRRMATSPPRPPSVRDLLPAEIGRIPDPDWVAFVAELANHDNARGRLMPNRPDQLLVALRCELAHGVGWSTDRLRRLLLTGLEGCQHLAGTWLYRLHPDQLPTPGQDAVPITEGRRPPPCGQCDARPGDPVSARVVWLDDGRSAPCATCHPRGIAQRPGRVTADAG
jgi:hypothetical protein